MTTSKLGVKIKLNASIYTILEDKRSTQTGLAISNVMIVLEQRFLKIKVQGNLDQNLLNVFIHNESLQSKQKQSEKNF